MAEILSIANQKGGVAKTTTTRHVAYFLEKLGARILVIDNDHQGNLTKYFGLDPVELDAKSGSLFHVLCEKRPIAEVMQKVTDHITVVPASLSLAEAGARLIQETDVNGVLKGALASVQDSFDVVLIDCGPNLERLLINALVASKWVLIPVKTDDMSISGVPALVQTISKVQRINPTLKILGVLPTIYHKHNIADEEALQDLIRGAEEVGVSVFEPVPAATNYDKAFKLQKAVFESFPKTVGKTQYEELAKVILSL